MRYWLMVMPTKEEDDCRDIQEFLRKNMPSLREIAPEEYDQLLGIYERIDDKYTEKAIELLREKGFKEFDKSPIVGCIGLVVAITVGGVTMAGKAYIKMYANVHGGEKSAKK